VAANTTIVCGEKADEMTHEPSPSVSASAGSSVTHAPHPRNDPRIVVPALVAGIHVSLCGKTRMAGTGPGHDDGMIRTADRRGRREKTCAGIKQP
jgi:hypothetical protein